MQQIKIVTILYKSYDRTIYAVLQEEDLHLGYEMEDGKRKLTLLSLRGDVWVES